MAVSATARLTHSNKTAGFLWGCDLHLKHLNQANRPGNELDIALGQNAPFKVQIVFHANPDMPPKKAPKSRQV